MNSGGGDGGGALTMPGPHGVPSRGGPFVDLQNKGWLLSLHHSCWQGCKLGY